MTTRQADPAGALARLMPKKIAKTGYRARDSRMGVCEAGLRRLSLRVYTCGGPVDRAEQFPCRCPENWLHEFLRNPSVGGWFYRSSPHAQLTENEHDLASRFQRILDAL